MSVLRTRTASHLGCTSTEGPRFSTNVHLFGAISLGLVLAISLSPAMACATVSTVSMQSPNVTEGGTQNLTSPVHFLGTAESNFNITGYVVYVDGENAYQNGSSTLNAWVVIGPGTHSVSIKAWDSSGSLASTSTYTINVTGFAPPTPPLSAARVLNVDDHSSTWSVDNDPSVGGDCNDGSILPFMSGADPNTANAPDGPSGGLHIQLASKCQYDDSLFYRKDPQDPSPYAGDTNVLWDFWFYIPTTTQSSSIQALEHDLYQAVQLSDGVHEFMFGSQCNYVTNQWQFWLPSNGVLTWTTPGASYPCQFSGGSWHHATYFLQRVTSTGYQIIPPIFSSSSDTNTSLRFGTLTIDGNTVYLGGVSWSTTPNWSPVLGVQHQLDSAQAGITIDEYIDKESVTTW